jgi:hypothetical protein
MSTRPRAPAWAMPPTGAPMRLATIALVLVAISLSLVVSGSVRAEPPPKVNTIEKKHADDPEVAVGPDVIEVGGEHLVTVELPPPPAGEDALHAGPARLLDVAVDGARVAVADEVGLHGGAATLTITQPDGSLILRDLPGLLGAAFSPDGRTLVALDGVGQLYRLDAESGDGDAVLEGPFIPPIAFEAAGTVLAQAVSSVEAPFQSRLVRIDPSNGSVTPLSADEIVFSATPLADGSIAYVAREPGGVPGVKRIAADGVVSLVAQLEMAATNVAISPEGNRFAYTVSGDGVYLVDTPGAPPVRLADGTAPEFSPDGTQVLLHLDEAAVVVGLDGSLVTELSEPSAAWIACADEECAP